MAESLPCSPETITRLLIGYIPIQNKKLKKKRNLGANYYRPKGLAQVSRTMKIIKDFGPFFPTWLLNFFLNILSFGYTMRHVGS